MSVACSRVFGNFWKSTTVWQWHKVKWMIELARCEISLRGSGLHLSSLIWANIYHSDNGDAGQGGIVVENVTKWSGKRLSFWSIAIGLMCVVSVEFSVFACHTWVACGVDWRANYLAFPKFLVRIFGIRSGHAITNHWRFPMVVEQQRPAETERREMDRCGQRHKWAKSKRNWCETSLHICVENISWQRDVHCTWRVGVWTTDWEAGREWCGWPVFSSNHRGKRGKRSIRSAIGKQEYVIQSKPGHSRVPCAIS